MTGPARQDLPHRVAAVLQRSARARVAASAALHRADRALEACNQRVAAITSVIDRAADLPYPHSRLRIRTAAQRTTREQALLEQAEIDGQINSTGLRYPHLTRR